MKIKYLYITNYKKFSNFEVRFDHGLDNELVESLFNKMNITALIGENGSGKTTILSFISIVFRYLQRNQNEIPSDFILKYQIEEEDIELSKVNDNVFISINDKAKNLLLEYDVKKKDYIRRNSQQLVEMNSITYDEIIEYLPSIIVVSSFDIDYPNGYAWNYIGHRLLKISSGYAIQKESSIGLDISLGILRFMEVFYGTNEYFVKLFQSLGLNLSDKVCAYFKQDNNSSENGIKDKILAVLYNYGITDREDLVNSMISGDYFAAYFSERNEALDSPYEVFDLKSYLSEKIYHSEILKLMIIENLFYINDFYLKKNEFEYSMSKMSTGEKMFLGRIFFILSNLQDNAIVILEEPEVHLNYSWVKQIVSVFILLFKGYSSHFLISSHNYSFINNLLSEQILVMEDEFASTPEFKTLLCSSEELNYHIFKHNNVKTYIEYYIHNLLVHSEGDKLKKMFDNLGESYTKVKLFKQLLDSGDLYVED